MRTLSAEELAVFKRTAERRDADGQLRLAQRLEAARQVAGAAAELLKREFQATPVILFGSLGTLERFHLSSDIDLAVNGLAPLDYFRAVAKLQDLSAFKVDLVCLERCRPSLKAIIELEGKAL